MQKRAIRCLLAAILLPVPALSQGGWIFNNPQPTGLDIFDIERDRSGSLWLVGESGMMMRSNDDGVTWQTLPWRTTQSLYDITILGTRSWVVGNSGTLLCTSNSGNSWDSVQLSSNKNLRKIQFYDDTRGWILAADSLLFLTTDGGNSWISRRINTSLPLNDMHFVSSSQGWLAAGFYRPPNIGWDEDAGGMLMKTTDGGLSWSVVDTGKTCFQTIFFLDGSNGWLGKRTVPFSNGVDRTTDGGSTWHSISSTSELHRMQFQSVTTGWALQLNYLRKTTDGGASWFIADEHRGDYYFQGLYMQNLQRGWSVSTSGFMRVTTNGGSSWSSLDRRLDIEWASLHDVVFCNPSEGWIVGHQYRSSSEDTSIVIRTQNGGQTWERQSLPYKNGPYAIAAIDNSNLWTIADSLAFFTTNGGTTWSKARVRDDDWIFRDIYFRNRHSGILVGSRALYKTSNGGETWQRQAGFSNIQFLRTIDFADSLYGWIVAHPGIGEEVTFQTTNGGATWALAAVSFSSIDFVDVLHGWAIGTDRRTYRTNNGGRTWYAASSTQIPSNWTTTIVAADTTVAWFWDTFRAYRTTDGGVSWSAERVVAYSLGWIDHGMHVIGRDLAWLVGGDGRIYTYRNGTTSVQSRHSLLPHHFSLTQNYPNPFNPTTEIRFSLPVKTKVSLQVFDILGRQIASLVSDELGPGEFAVPWQAHDHSSGVYFLRMATPQFVQAKRMLLLK